MKTATKNNFSDQTIRCLVKSHFPQAILSKIERIVGGTFNTVYLLEGSGLPDASIMLKTGPHRDVEVPKHEADNLKTEIYTYQLLENQNIQVPRIYAHDFSHSIIPHDFFFMEKISGKTWYEISPKKTPQLMYELGRQTAEMHKTKGSWFGTINDETDERFDTWSQAFQHKIETLLKEVEARGSTLPIAEIRHQIALRKDLLDEVKTPRLVNFDLWAGNVFLEKGSDWQIAGVIDFERSFFGDPMASFVSALFLYDNVEKEPHFIQGYNQVSQELLVITEDDRERMWLYTLLFYLRAYVETERYQGLMKWGQKSFLSATLTFMTRALNRRWKKRLKARKDEK